MQGIKHSSFFFTICNSDLLSHWVSKTFSLYSSPVCPKPCNVKIGGRGVAGRKEILVISHNSLWYPLNPAYIGSGVITQPALLGSWHIPSILPRHITRLVTSSFWLHLISNLTHSGKSNLPFLHLY